MPKSENPTRGPGRNYLDLVEQMVSETKYGSITVIIQDGKVIQVEQNKKIRLTN